MVAVILAHPYPDRSRANAALARALEGLPGLDVRSLYDLYPTFAIDAEAERRALAEAKSVVWQHPLYWYSVPALLKLWFEKVLVMGWAYGAGGHALRGKRCLWVVTTGGDAESYSPEGGHRHTFETFVPSIRQTAEFCGMEWLEPIVLHGAHKVDDAFLIEVGETYRSRVEALVAEEGRDHA